LDAGMRGYAALHRVAVCVERGEIETARVVLEQGRELAAEAGDDPYLRIGLEATEGKVLAAEGRTEEAIQKLWQAGRQYAEIGDWADAIVVTREIAELYANGGQEHQAWEYMLLS